MSSVAVSLDIVHILILHGATSWNFPPSASGLDTSSCQLNTFRLQLELPRPHLDPETSEQTLGNQSGFSLKRQRERGRDQTASCTVQVVFLHREHHISCNISSSHGALMTSLPEQQGSPHSLPTLTTCQAASTSHALVLSPGRAALFFFLLFPLRFFLVSRHKYLKSD